MQVFISYSSRDRIDALQVKALVDAMGHDAWMDVFDLRTGAALRAALERKIKDSGAVILLLSPFAVESPWVADEITYAREAQEKGVVFVPIILRSTRIPDALGDLRAINASRGLGDESVRLDIEKALGGEIDEALILNAQTRAELADRALVDEAEAAFPGIKEDLSKLFEQAIRKLELVIDYSTWPTPDQSWLQIQIKLDIFKGAANLFLAPYREGETWSKDLGFAERSADEFFAQTKPRVDARFSYLGRNRDLFNTIDGTSMGERPLEFTIEFDGSEFTGEERAKTMLIAERYELPSIKELINKGSEIILWKFLPDKDEIAVDSYTTDIDMRLYASFDKSGVSTLLRLWSSKRSREESVIEQCQTLMDCKSPIEREILLDAFYPRSLRQSLNQSSRRDRIGNALDNDETIPENDGWAAFRMRRGGSEMLAHRGRFLQAAEELRKALDHLPQNLELDRDYYGAMFEYWDALMRMATLLTQAKGSEEALRFYADEAVRTAEQAAEYDPQEPDYQRAVSRALIHRVGIFINNFGTADLQDLQRAEQVISDLAAQSNLPWRAQEAEQVRTETAKLRKALGKPSAHITVKAPLSYAKWLDPNFQADEPKLLQISQLLRYSAMISERVPWTSELHLVKNELIQLLRSDDQVGWFGVSLAETSYDDPKTFTKNSALQRPPLSLLLDKDINVLKWEKTKELGNISERLELEKAFAVRALILKNNEQRLRLYLFDARTHFLRWLVALALPSRGDNWKDVEQDDATAAITFSSLNLN